MYELKHIPSTILIYDSHNFECTLGGYTYKGVNTDCHIIPSQSVLAMIYIPYAIDKTIIKNLKQRNKNVYDLIQRSVQDTKTCSKTGHVSPIYQTNPRKIITGILTIETDVEVDTQDFLTHDENNYPFTFIVSPSKRECIEISITNNEAYTKRYTGKRIVECFFN